MSDIWNTAMVESEHNKVLSTRRELLKALQRFGNREIIGSYDGAEAISGANENDMLWALEQMTPEEIMDALMGLADAFLENDDD